jgi:hypothetical protein
MHLLPDSITCALFLIASVVYAQGPASNELLPLTYWSEVLQKDIEPHDKDKFDAAIVCYPTATPTYSLSASAKTELLLIHLAVERYQESVNIAICALALHYSGPHSNLVYRPDVFWSVGQPTVAARN